MGLDYILGSQSTHKTKTGPLVPGMVSTSQSLLVFISSTTISSKSVTTSTAHALDSKGLW